MRETQWLLCPVCRNKTRIKLLKYTEFKKFPLSCPKCKNETLIEVKDFKVKVIEPADELVK